MSEKLVNLLDFDIPLLEKFFAELGEKPFRAMQIYKWVHQQGVTDFAQMTNLSKALREKLTTIAHIHAPNIALVKVAKDGTRKWLLQLDEGNCIEAVYIPEEDRGTLCVSSQVGCALNCTFCSTATQGFNRNLKVSEIIGQLFVVKRELAKVTDTFNRVTNVVFMGMGEPLLNFDNVVAATNIMIHDCAYGLSKRRVTLSTSGVVPEMRRLAQVSDISLAVSLHAPNDALRCELVPINKKYPIKMLLAACKEHFPPDSHRKVLFEYVMLDGVNDSLANAKELAQVLAGMPCKINLIPFNPYPGTQYRCSPFQAIKDFQTVLMRAGFITTIRKTRGEDTDAACGQLVGRFHDRTSRSSKWQEGLA